jgi:hypothetical protein
MEAVVRVRGIDARVGGHGWLYTTRAPETLMVHDSGKEQRLHIPPERSVASPAAFALTAIGAIVAGRIIARIGGR